MQALDWIGDNVVLLYDMMIIAAIVGYSYYKALSKWPEKGHG